MEETVSGGKRSVLIGPGEIADRVRELGQTISADYQGTRPVLIGILKGAFIFLADLARAIDLEVEIDFIRVASYGDATTTSGTIRLTKTPEIDLRGREILLVEDIVDTGTTLAWLRNYFREQGAGRVRICTLIDKQERRQKAVEVDYAGFRIDSGFLVGYGLDHAERHRNLDAVYRIEE